MKVVKKIIKKANLMSKRDLGQQGMPLPFRNIHAKSTAPRSGPFLLPEKTFQRAGRLLAARKYA